VKQLSDCFGQSLTAQQVTSWSKPKTLSPNTAEEDLVLMASSRIVLEPLAGSPPDLQYVGA
jgi:hypothetical protein